ncbi:MAG: HK97 family phage prohead protease, partial [Novosphingobium sp.]
MTASTIPTVRPFTGRFAGYAAIFGRPDAGGDVIRPGAFAASLSALKDKGEPLPLFWQHRPEQTIGWIEHVAEDARGLRVI